MIIPYPLPDELSLGHLGRIGRLNASISEAINPHHWDLNKIANLCSIDAENYAYLHSFLPFSQFLTRIVEKPNQERWGARSRRLKGFEIPRYCASLCAQCVVEDMQFRGYSYWRRSHQIRGMLWCQKHGDVLLCTSTSTAYDSTPVESLAKAKPPDRCFEKQLDKVSPDIMRYLNICTQLLEYRNPVDIRKIRRLFNERAKKAGLQIVKSQRESNVQFLSDLLIERFPIGWLTSVFPGIGNKSKGKYFPSIDRVVYTAPYCTLGESIAMALLILFNNEASEGMDWMNDPCFTNEVNLSPLLPAHAH